MYYIYGTKFHEDMALAQATTPEPYIFLKLDDKAVPTRGRSWVVRDACSSNKRWSTFFFKIVWAFYGSDLTGFYQSFVKVILKSGSAAGIIEKSRKRNACDQLWDAHSTALPQLHCTLPCTGTKFSTSKMLLTLLYSAQRDSIGVRFLYLAYMVANMATFLTPQNHWKVAT